MLNLFVKLFLSMLLSLPGVVLLFQCSILNEILFFCWLSTRLAYVCELIGPLALELLVHCKGSFGRVY